MYGMPLNYTLIGGSIICPDCFQIMANSNDLSGPTIQKTLFRNHEETDSDFWRRVLDTSRGLVGPMGFYASVVIFCKYDTPYIPNVEIYDNWQNYVRTVFYIADSDPSQKVRVSALCGLADLLIAKEKRARLADAQS